MEWKHLKAQSKRGLPWRSAISVLLVIVLFAAVAIIQLTQSSSPNFKLTSLNELSDATATAPIVVDLSNSSLESGETNYYWQRSAWWKYTATANYSVTFKAAAWSAGNLAICVTTSFANCSAGSFSDGNGTASFTSGATYYIRVSSAGATRGVFMMTRGTLSDNYVAPNDDFANAQVIAEPAAGASSATTTIDMTNLTTQSGEAAVTGQSKTAWFKYTPTSSYVADITVQGLGGNAASCVTTSLGSCSLSNLGGNSFFALSLTSGTTYYIRLNPNTAQFAFVGISRAGTDNDNFANATNISELAAGASTGTITVDNTNATFEPGEGNAERGRWYKYTTTVAQILNVNPSSAWGGALNQCVTTVVTSCSLGYAGSNPNGYTLAASTTYYIRLSVAEQGSFSVSRAFNDNDQFANATVISELADGQSTGTIPVNYTGATLEQGESTNGGYQSRWWKYSPTANQTLNVSQGGPGNGGNNFWQCVGTAIGNCSAGNNIVYSSGSWGYALSAGTTYYIRSSTSGAVDGNIRFTRAPNDNDLFSNATNIPELAAGATAGTISWDLSNAGLENGETTIGFRSRWWKYTPSASYSVSIAQATSSNASGQATYQCVTTAIGSCNVGSSVIYGPNSLAYSLTSGTTYYIRISTSGSNNGTFRLSRNGSDNDSFSGATVIPELSPGTSTTTTYADLFSATKEPGEAGTGIRSRWWKYTPTANQTVDINESTPSASQSGLVYQCVTTAFGSCTNGDNSGYGNLAFAYNLTSGTTYYFRISSGGADQVSFIVVRNANDNDQAANATAISEIANNTAGNPINFDLSNATWEPAEQSGNSGSRSRFWTYTPSSSYSLRIAGGTSSTGTSGGAAVCVSTTLTSCTLGQMSIFGTAGANFALTAGTSYYIRINSNGPTAGSIILSRGTVADAYVPPNDNFASATTISELAANAKSALQNVNNTNATAEAGEVNQGTTQRSSWWKYTPTSNYTVDVVTTGIGESMASCVTTVKTSCSEGTTNSGNGIYAYALTSGTTYYIRMTPNNANYGVFALWRTNSGNDNFANATAMGELAAGTSSPMQDVDTSNATYEVGEATPVGDRQSLWWSYTPSSSYTVNVITSGVGGDLAYCLTTSMSTCSAVSSASNGMFAYNLTSGTTYYIRITNQSTHRGGFRLVRAGSGNDMFANATALSEQAAGTMSAPVNFDLSNATVEPNENATVENRSLWWSYTPTASYVLNVAENGDGSSSALCVTTAINSCSSGSQNGNQSLGFAVTSGTTYYIRISPNGATTGSFTVRRATTDNDNFANATAISELGVGGVSPTYPVDVSKATVESNEIVQGDQRSRWWSYTPTSNYTINVNSNSDGDNMGSCITTAITSCSQGYNPTSGIYAYALTSGTTYYIRMSGNGSNNGSLSVSRSDVGGNDNFANATAISELAAGTTSPASTFNLTTATAEAGEVTYGSPRSQWWKYTATASYPVNVTVNGDGGAVATCITTAIGSCSVGQTSGSGTTVFSAVSGTTYYIRLSGNGWQSGRLALNRAANDNDQFANATAIQQFDNTKPTTGTVYDGSVAGVETSSNNGSTTSLSANWAGFSDAGTGIGSYEYSIGTAAGGTSVVNWTSVGAATTATATGLSLTVNQRYYVNVRATDYAGNVSNVVSSPGQTVAATLSVTITGVASGAACGDVTTTQSSSNTSSGLNPPVNGSQAIAGANLSVVTNAPGGYVLNVTAAPMTSAARTMTAVSGTNAAPATWPAANTEAFGYATSSSALSGTANRFRTAKFAAFTATQSEVMRNAAATAGDSGCVAVSISKSPTSAAGSYSTQVIFTAVPSF